MNLLDTAGNDTLFGGSGVLDPEDDADTITASTGDDVLYGNGGEDVLYGGAGSDYLYGGMLSDTLYGGSGETDEAGDDTADSLSGGPGADVLYGGIGNDFLRGDEDGDTLFGGDGDDWMHGGTNLSDELGDGADLMFGNGGNDMLVGNHGNDTLYGGSELLDPNESGNDTLEGGAGDDLLYGNGGDDSLVGGDGADTLYGGVGNNTLSGGAGADVIYSASEGDSLIGGDGLDTFIIDGDSISGADISGRTAPGITQAAFGTGLAFRIADLEAGETIRINNLHGNANLQIQSVNGETALTRDGTTLVILENVAQNMLSLSEGGQSGSFSVVANSTSQEVLPNTSSGAGSSPVNDPPVISGLATPVTFLENTANASAQMIDTDITFTDNATDLDGGNLTVTYSSGGGAEDYLYIRHLGDSAGQIGFDGATIRYAGTTIGTLTSNGAAGADLVVSFNTNAAPANIDALIESLTYYNASDTPTAARIISVTVNDGELTSTAVTSSLAVTAEADAAAPASYALSALDGTNGTRLDGIDASDFSAISLSTGGDINNDGYDDVIIGAYRGDPGGDSSAGETYVAFGKASGWAASIDLSTLDGTTGFRLDGIDANDYSGITVSTAGDVNGDGFDDIIIGAAGGDPGAKAFAGESYVVFGKASGWASSIDLSTLDGTTGFRLDGVDAVDLSGISVSNAGDVNGDGFDDIIIGAYYADPGGDSTAGESYVVFGKASGWAAAMDLSSLDGSTGFRLDGIDAGDKSGRFVSEAGDINGDGYSDIIIGAYRSDPGGRSNAGESYVVFGKGSGWASSIDLSALDGTTGFRLDGIDASDESGRKVSEAGDVNGDGYDDFMISARSADPGGDSAAGETYVIFGKASGWAAAMDLSSLDGTSGFRLDGIDASDQAGTFIASAGDFNGDGFSDVLIGANLADPSGKSAAGETYIVFGKASGWAAAIDLSTLDGTTGTRLDGVDANDESGTTVSYAGDVNGDGFDDVMVGAIKAAPGGDSSAGETYILFGNNDSGAVDAIGTTGDDTISGTVNADVFIGGLGDDMLVGFDGNDILKGANGADNLLGVAGNDKLYGGNGDDTLTGGACADTMFGGNDSDVFDFNAVGESSSSNLDVLHINFDDDSIDISGIGAANANTINTVTGVAASSLADVIGSYDNSSIDQIGDANLLQVTSGTLTGNHYVIISTDGNATYDEGIDLFFQVRDSGTFDVTDIV